MVVTTKVMASVGHIQDLKKSTMSIDFDNNWTGYINIRGKVPWSMIWKKKSQTSLSHKWPGPRGYFLAFSAYLDLDVKEKNRVVFAEITKDAVKML